MNILGEGENEEAGAEKSSCWGCIMEGFADESKDFSFYSRSGGESLRGIRVERDHSSGCRLCCCWGCFSSLTSTLTLGLTLPHILWARTLTPFFQTISLRIFVEQLDLGDGDWVSFQSQWQACLLSFTGKIMSPPGQRAGGLPAHYKESEFPPLHPIGSTPSMEHNMGLEFMTRRSRPELRSRVSTD